jgi:hypothetical protein
MPAISYPSRALSSDDSCRVAADHWDDRRGGRTSRRRSTVICPLPPSTNVGDTGETTWKASDRFDRVPLTVRQFRILLRVVIADDPATVTSTVVETVRAVILDETVLGNHRRGNHSHDDRQKFASRPGATAQNRVATIGATMS